MVVEKERDPKLVKVAEACAAVLNLCPFGWEIRVLRNRIVIRLRAPRLPRF